MKSVGSRAKAILVREMTYTIFGKFCEILNHWLRMIVLALQKMVAWSLISLAERLRWAKFQLGNLDPDAWLRFARASLKFKFWHLMALMGGVSVVAPLVVLPRAPVFLGPICAFNAVIGIVLVVKARRSE